MIPDWFYGFDLLELNNEDIRLLPLEKRKAKLESYWRGPRGCDLLNT
jgi:ATP-dependent DNA ligase